MRKNPFIKRIIYYIINILYLLLLFHNSKNSSVILLIDIKCHITQSWRFHMLLIILTLLYNKKRSIWECFFFLTEECILNINIYKNVYKTVQFKWLDYIKMGVGFCQLVTGICPFCYWNLQLRIENIKSEAGRHKSVQWGKLKGKNWNRHTRQMLKYVFHLLSPFNCINSKVFTVIFSFSPIKK